MVTKFHKCSSPLYEMDPQIRRADCYEIQCFFKHYTLFSVDTNMSPMRMRIIALTNPHLH